MNTPTTNLPLRQLMLTFAYLAYTGEEISPLDNPDPTINKLINKALPKIQLSGGESPGDWDVVWGPVTYTVPGAKYQENMLYVVNRRGSNDFVIANRGTNFVSQVDWFLDDFEIYYTMPWPVPQSGKPAEPGVEISESTSIDLNIVIEPSLMSFHNVGLIEFLRNITQEHEINLCVTGHSLGAALANVLSLYLLENPDLWDHTGASTVSCISFAAPTIGNDKLAVRALNAFAEASQKGTFPGWDESLGTNMDNVRSNMDTIPLFSTASNIYVNEAAGPLFSIYSTPNNPSGNIKFDFSITSAPESHVEWDYFQSYLLAKVASALAEQNYTQLLQSKSLITGEFIGNTIDLNNPGLTTVLEAFATQAAWQHSNSYPAVLDTHVLLDPRIVNKSGEENPTLAIPHIDSISPDSNEHYWIKTDISVTITGKNFSTGFFSNFIVFSDPKFSFPYEVKSVTDTEIKVVFKTGGTPKGEYKFTIFHTTLFNQSNEVSFKIERL